MHVQMHTATHTKTDSVVHGISHTALMTGLVGAQSSVCEEFFWSYDSLNYF